MINKIIAESLRAGRRLVIPQFGAFLHKDTDGGVVFVPFLKKDDGVLLGQLVSSFGLSNEEAYELIGEYVAQVQQSIAERGFYLVEGVGQLRVDSNGVCYLESNVGASTARTAGVPRSEGQPVGRPQTIAQPTTGPSSQSRPSASQGVGMPYPGQSIAQNQAQRPMGVASAPQQRSQQPSAPSAPQQSYRQREGQPVAPRSMMQSPQGQARQQMPPYPSQEWGGAPTRPMVPHRNGAKGGTDKFLIVAIAAALIALCAIIYGALTASRGQAEIEPMELPAHQRPAILDTIRYQDSVRAAEEAEAAAKKAARSGKKSTKTSKR